MHIIDVFAAKVVIFLLNCKYCCTFVANYIRNSMRRLIFASNNAHKLEEVRRILAPAEVLSLNEVGFHADIDETGQTLSENSLIKAQTIATWLQTQSIDGDFYVFADDTGLEIEALNSAPGVITARWAGEPACDANNRKKALAELSGITNRKARFRTVVTIIHGNTTRQVEGEVRGTITSEERGNSGFGYDAIFMPDGYNKTFGELPAETKNQISHRARAIAKLADLLKNNVL